VTDCWVEAAESGFDSWTTAARCVDHVE